MSSSSSPRRPLRAFSLDDARESPSHLPFRRPTKNRGGPGGSGAASGERPSVAAAAAAAAALRDCLHAPEAEKRSVSTETATRPRRPPPPMTHPSSIEREKRMRELDALSIAKIQKIQMGVRKQVYGLTVSKIV